MSLSPESKLKSDVMDYLKMGRHMHFRMQSGKVQVRGAWMRLCPIGTADVLIFLKNRPAIWVELKAPGALPDKKRDEAQAAFAREVLDLGHTYKVCRSVAEVAAFLGEVASGEPL